MAEPILERPTDRRRLVTIGSVCVAADDEPIASALRHSAVERLLRHRWSATRSQPQTIETGSTGYNLIEIGPDSSRGQRCLIGIVISGGLSESNRLFLE